MRLHENKGAQRQHAAAHANGRDDARTCRRFMSVYGWFIEEYSENILENIKYNHEIYD
jgi:hypothetical protein